MAYANNYGNVAVKGITYTGKGSDPNPAVSYWTIDPNTTKYYSWYTNASPAGYVSEVASSATKLYLQYYVADGGTLATDPYRVGWYSTASFGYVRDDAFPTGYNTVTYAGDGGTNVPSGQTLVYGSTLTLSSTVPTKTGYDFGGWKSSKSGTTYQAGATLPATEYTSYAWNGTPSTLTLTAQWTLKTYQIAYNKNAADAVGSIGNQTKTYGVNLTLSNGAAFSRTLYTLSKWNTASNGGGTSYALSGTYSANAGATMYAVWSPNAPSAPTSVTNTRNSDSKNTVTWTNPSAVISSTQILRSIDGGAYSTIATLSGSTTSYVDTTTSANHSYAYKVKVVNASGSATSSATSTTYNTPAAPTAISAVRQDATTVLLTITNPAITATALEIQRSTDGSTWSTASTVAGIVTSATDTPGGGTYYYRARNTRSTLVSAWSPVSNAVVTIVPPNAPTLVSPVSGAVVSTSTANILFQWQHNPIDGSAQSAAQLQYSTDGGSTWTTQTVNSSAQSYSLANSFAVNDVVTWRVRTKGADASYGPYSSARQFYVFQQPTVTFTSPTNGATITNMPLSISLSYSDVAPSVLANAVVTISQGGAVLYTVDMGTATTATVTADEFLPNNGETYDLMATVRSTSGLQSTGAITVGIGFSAPDVAIIEVENNGESGSCQIQVTVDLYSGGARAESISLYRVSKNGRILLVDGFADGGIYEDIYAPLNVDYTYEAATFSAAGAVGTSTYTNHIATKRMFFLWGGNVAYGAANPGSQITQTRPEKVRIHYVGKDYPNSYDSSAVDDRRTASFDIFTLAMSDLFEQLVADGGRCYYKSIDGDVFFADVDVVKRPNLRISTRYGAVTCNIWRIQGQAV